MKVGVYVGSFNPPHIGHKNVIDILINKKIVDKILIIPSNSYWDKKVDVDVKDRINMLKFYENENVIVNEELNNIKYTYRVLDELSKQYNDIYLIIGADNMINFYKWKNVDKILKHHVVVMPRNGIDVKKHLSKFDESKFIIVNFDNIDVSSTYIREKLINKDYNSVIHLLDKRILKYIKEHKLYLK